MTTDGDGTCELLAALAIGQRSVITDIRKSTVDSRFSVKAFMPCETVEGLSRWRLRRKP